MYCGPSFRQGYIKLLTWAFTFNYTFVFTAPHKHTNSPVWSLDLSEESNKQRAHEPYLLVFQRQCCLVDSGNITWWIVNTLTSWMTSWTWRRWRRWRWGGAPPAGSARPGTGGPRWTGRAPSRGSKETTLSGSFSETCSVRWKFNLNWRG